MSGICRLLFVAGCLGFVALCWLLVVGCCFVFVVCCVFIFCCLRCVAHFLLLVGSRSLVVFVVCCLLVFDGCLLLAAS